MSNNVMDNNTYNLIMALASTLEAREAYSKYQRDGKQQLWSQLIQQCDQTVQMLRGELSRSLSGSQGQSMHGQSGYASSGGMGGSMGSNQGGYTTDMGGGRPQ